MNIFAVDEDPSLAAYQLPDKHIVKMPLECCQMLSIVYSDWYHRYGPVFNKDGRPYNTKKGAFRNHPCTKWVAESDHNLAWMFQHAFALCEEYTFRYDKVHSCERSLRLAALLAPTEGCPDDHTPFARAMPDVYKYDTSIDTVTAYQRYVASKPWVNDNYLRVPDRKPSWVALHTPSACV